MRKVLLSFGKQVNQVQEKYLCNDDPTLGFCQLIMHRRESGKQISAWENIKMLIHTNSALGDMIVSKFQNIMNMKFRRHWQVEVYQRKENKKNYMRPTLRKLHHYHTLRHPLEEVNKIDNVSENKWSYGGGRGLLSGKPPARFHLLQKSHFSPWTPLLLIVSSLLVLGCIESAILLEMGTRVADFLHRWNFSLKCHPRNS